MRLAVQLLAFVVGAWALGLALVGAVDWLVRHGDIAGAIVRALGSPEDEEDGR